MPLTARKISTVLSEHCFKSHWKLVYKIKAPCHFCYPDNLLHIGAFHTKREIFKYRSRKQKGFLRNIRYLISERFEINILDIVIIKQNFTFFSLIEIHQQLYKSSFARAAFADKRNFLALLNIKVNIVQNKSSCAVTKITILKLNITFQRFRNYLLNRCIFYRRIKHFTKTFSRNNGGLHHRLEIDKIFYGSKKISEQCIERDKLTKRYLTFYDLVCPKPENCRTACH